MITHERHSVRLRGYDYSQNGYYFVTVCTRHRVHIFGEIEEGRFIGSAAGKIIEKNWYAMADMGVINHAPTIRLDVFQLMPDHIHGILIIDRNVGAQFIAPKIGQIIRKFKAICSVQLHRKGINQIVWQRGFYEHIIRSEKELQNVRKYILTNPSRWGNS